MSLEKLWKEAKHVLAFVLAIALFFNGWANYDFSVFAENESQDLTVEVENVTYTGCDLKESIKITVTDAAGNPITDYQTSWTNDNDESVDEIVNAGTYYVTVSETVTESGNSITRTGTGSLVVEPKTLTEDMVFLEKDSGVVNGQNHAEQIKVTVKDGEASLSKDTDYTVTIPETITVKDEYKITVTGTGNYIGAVGKIYTLGYAADGTAEIEGSTYQDNVYADKVEIHPVEGYTISRSAAGEFVEKLTFTDTPESYDVYLKNSNNGEITEYKLEAFTIDKDVPTLTLTEPDGEWASSKEIGINATGADAAYYSKNEITIISPITALPEGLTELTSDGKLTIAETIESEKIYYFYAIDKAGHVATASCVVNKIDAESPTVTVSEDYEYFHNDVYWKSSEDINISVALRDNESGVTSVEMPEGFDAPEFTEGDKEITKELAVSSAGEYSVEVADQAENSVSKTFIVKQDTVAPEITLSEPEGNDLYQAGEGIYWFSDNEIKIPLNITDEAGTDEEKSAYTVAYSTKSDMADSKNIDVSENQYTAIIELSKPDELVTYYFQAKDIAGNKSQIRSVQLGYDNEGPEITELKLTQKNDAGWINADSSITVDGKEGTKVSFSLEATDEQTGIQKIQYRLKDQGEYKDAAYSVDQDVYTFTTEETYSDEKEYIWEIRVLNHVGKETIQKISGGIDITAPSENAYIKFLSDTVGANDPNRGTVEEDKWSSKIYEMASSAWNKIWGRESVKFEVYVQDMTSGIDTITMSYNENAAINLEKVAGLKAFIEGDINSSELTNGNDSGYTVFEGTISYTEKDGLAIQNFKIDSMTDVAGNKLDKAVILNTAENTDIIYLDNVAPELTSVTIDDVDVRTEEKYFYNTEQTITLTIEERFFGEENTPVKPIVNLYSRDDVDAEFEATEKSTEQWIKNDDGTWSVTMKITGEEESEIEYKLIMSRYADPSGNVLTGDGVKDGVFESKIFVIDKLTPKLLNYSVTAPSDCEVNGIPVYKNDTKNPDVKVNFEIDDNASYYESSKENLIVNVYKDTEEDPFLVLSEDELKKDLQDRSHKYSFKFDARTTSENEFHVEISYRDQADNALENKTSILTSVEGKDDTYKSGQFIIDHVAPVFNVEYSDAVNVVKDGKSEDTTQPLSEHTAYYSGNIDVTLTFDEKYVNILSNNFLEHFEIEVKKDGDKIETPTIKWSHVDNKHTAKFEIAKKDDHSTDGNYQFVVKYRDCAFNAMIAEDAEADYAKLMTTESDKTVGIYTSPILVLDTTAPVVTTKYMNGETEVQPKQTAYGRDYFNDVNTAFQITVEDRNIRYKELKNVLKGMDAYNIDKTSISGTDLKKEIDDIADTGVMYANGKENAKIWTLNLPLSTEANYDIPVNFVDLAGNAAVVNGSVGTFTEQVTTDSTIPGLDLSYSIDDPANYWEWGYLFAKKKMTVTVTATDEIAGVQTIKFTIVDENGKETVKTETFKPVGKSTYSVDIPLKTEDFKGSIFAEVFDYSTNTNSQKRGHIVESTSKHSATGTAKITTLTNPSRTVGGVDFYNTDVKFQLLLEDTYSGLGSWEYTGGETLKDTATYKADAGTDLTKDPFIKIVPKLDRTLTLDAQKNNKNDVLVKASFVDNVGHELSIEQKYNIDVTKPTITVEYDLNEPANEKYYKETRTATVKITERNFDSSDVEFIITSTDGPKPEISGWSKSGTGDNTVHTCTVTFAQDSDYTFTLKFRDMAGNVADYDRVDEFTIDKTIPVATVTYDNNSFLNEYYYDAARTATIDILEHNFDPSAMEIMVTADGSTAGVPHISAWSSNGDHNIATITFSADAEYTFDFVGMDLALNELEDYTPDHFVVDQTAPELEIFDIEHMSANNGVVRPGIRYHDTNYDQNGTVILMTGYHNGVVEMTGDRKLEANGLELKLDDFAYVQEMDDIYTMEATVYDLAGNSSEAMVMFSVNRFGSVYTFDEATDALIGDNGKYYTNKEQQLVITETNVDTLEFKEITLNLNGKLTTLKEGVDYTVALDGNDATWKQYTYTLKADNFVEEGTYILTIYSEDRATNTSDNNTKGKKIEFVVDKTNPSALISGVENGGQYRMHSKEMTIDIEDNVRLSSVTVTIDGVETVYDAAQIQKMDGKLVLNIGSANHWQNVVVEVTDAAGNTEISEEMRVLVTANIFVQFFMNKPVFYGTLGGTALLAALLWWFLVGKKKKEEQTK